jgi:hypothetical protein
VRPQPLATVGCDRQHDDDLGEEEEPDDPVADGRQRRPRLARRGLLDDDDGDDEERRDYDGQLEAALEPCGTFVHALLRFDV